MGGDKRHTSGRLTGRGHSGTRVIHKVVGGSGEGTLSYEEGVGLGLGDAGDRGLGRKTGVAA